MKTVLVEFEMKDIEMIERAHAALLKLESEGFLHTAGAIRAELKRMKTDYLRTASFERGPSFVASSFVTVTSSKRGTEEIHAFLSKAPRRLPKSNGVTTECKLTSYLLR